jgi:hypothetical protein
MASIVEIDTVTVLVASVVEVDICDSVVIGRRGHSGSNPILQVQYFPVNSAIQKQ